MSHWHNVIVSLVLASLGVAALCAPARALDGSCGGAVLCECGDFVASDKRLSDADPVTGSVCPETALTLADGHRLDLDGHTLRGSGSGVGVALELRSSNSDIRGGTIARFATGIRGLGARRTTISGMQLLDNQVAGLDLSPGSDRNVIDHIRIEGGGVAVRIEGNENILRSLTLHDTEGILVRGGFPDDPEETPPGISLTRSRVEDTRGNGIVVVGFRNTIARNVVVRSTGDGIVVSGGFRTVNSENVVSNNRVSFSGGQGLRFGGIGHTVFRNVAKTNEETGFLVEATGSTFERNHGLGNGRFGIEDTTAGDGTAGTANAYASNLCHTANALGRSSPAGLCR